jgi:F420-0:gamma-glutamyl ligase
MMDARDSEIRQAQEQTKVRETLILQKINASHRVAFTEKFPGQCEHILRLLTERLQAGLDKRDGVVITDTTTWKLHASEIADLADAVYKIHIVRESLRNKDAG